MTFSLTHSARKLSLTSCAWLALILGSLVGCSGTPNPDGRENVSGTITLNGKPLTGMAGIVFAPTDATSTAGGQGMITAGKYALTGANGVKPGKYIVRITASVDFDKKTGKPADSNIIFGNEVPVDIVPAEFNKNSKIEFEVVAGKNNVFDYDIQTSFVPEMPKNVKTKEAIPL